MRKKIICIAAIALVFGVVLCACVGRDGKNEIKIENTDWQLQAAMRTNIANKEEEMIAGNAAGSSEGADAPDVAVRLAAKDGTITITNLADENASFGGTYQKADVIGLETAMYNVTVDGLSGHANVSFTKYAGGAKRKTLVLTLTDKNDENIQYTLTFIAGK